MSIIRTARTEPGQGGTHVVALEGEIDMVSSSVLLEPIQALADPPPARVVFDLEAVSFIDSTGLSALIQADMAAKAAGSTLVLRSVPPRILKLMKLTQLDRALTIEPGGDGS
jgi:anti-sigma B factor antagonist